VGKKYETYKRVGKTRCPLKHVHRSGYSTHTKNLLEKNAGRNQLRNMRLVEYRPKNTISRLNISKQIGWGV